MRLGWSTALLIAVEWGCGGAPATTPPATKPKTAYIEPLLPVQSDGTWYCYDSKFRNGVTLGRCYRTHDDCYDGELHSRNNRSPGENGTHCYKRREAFCVNAWSCYNRLSDCQRHHAKDRCRRIRAPGEPIESLPPAKPIACELSDWSCLAGLRFGADEADARGHFGAPADVKEKKDGNVLDYGGSKGLTIILHANSTKVHIISLGEQGVQLLRSKGLDDPKLQIVGKHEDKVFELLGAPHDKKPRSGLPRWLSEEDGLKTELNVRCAELDDFVCTSIVVYWHNP